MELTKEQAVEIVKGLLKKGQSRLASEVAGENDETLDRVLRDHRARMARHSWKNSQKWCKWDADGPVLMPDYTRIYYRKGKTEVLLQEFPPQVRVMKFKGSLAQRPNSSANLDQMTASKIFHYSLALPYVVFIFKYTDGLFTEVRCAFNDRPLKRLEERPLRPYLSNIDSNLSVCLGTSLDRTKLEKGNVTQQSAFVLSHFWQTSYSDEWSQHYWDLKRHFQSEDKRLSDLAAWQQSSLENSLFVIEDVDWLQHHEESFGDIVVRMFDDDTPNHTFHEELYDDLAKNCLTGIKETFDDNLKRLGDKAIDAVVEKAAVELMEKLGVPQPEQPTQAE